MATTVTIDSVTTGDAAPTAAPHRISNQATKSRATVQFTPTVTDGFVRAWRIHLGGSGRSSGVVLAKRGLVCGLDRCGPAALSLAHPSGVQITDDIDYGEVAGADGDYTVNIWARGEADGWNV